MGRVERAQCRHEEFCRGRRGKFDPQTGVGARPHRRDGLRRQGLQKTRTLRLDPLKVLRVRKVQTPAPPVKGGERHAFTPAEIRRTQSASPLPPNDSPPAGLTL